MPTPSLADTLYHWSLRQQIYEADRRQTLQREREEWLSYKAQRLASLIDYEHDEMWVLKGFEKLKGGPVLGSGSCAQLPQIHGSVPLTKFWKPGPKIHGNEVIIPYGTAIATFVNGVYPNWEHGNHAAIFGRGWSGHLDGKLTSGIVIFDQWKESLRTGGSLPTATACPTGRTTGRRSR